MPNPYKLPSYRHVTVEGHPTRAYLVLAADIHGQWSASYHAWLGESESGTGQYVIVYPSVEMAPSPSKAMQRLKRALKEAGE